MNKPALKPLQNAIAACAFEISTAGDRIQLFPAGKFRAADGRPTDCAHWFIDAVVAKHLIAALSVRKNPIVIDYEHQTLRTGERRQLSCVQRVHKSDAVAPHGRSTGCRSRANQRTGTTARITADAGI